MKTMTIGAFSERAGVPRETVRYYERRGLLPPPRRSAAGYRRYGEADVARVRFIRRAQRLGFTLSQIAELLALHENPAAEAAPVKALAEQKLAEIDEKISSLRRMRRRLQAVAAACDGSGATSECPILDGLRTPGEAHAPAEVATLG